MTYRELLTLYKKGKLDSETKDKIEAEIERQDAISEYLYEESALLDFDKTDSFSEHVTDNKKNDDGEEHFIKMIQNSIRKAFIKMGLIVGTVVLICILLAQFLLPHIVSKFYYQPDKIVAGDTNQMSLDMAVYTELFLPGYQRSDVSAKDYGYGNYDICIHQNLSYNFLFTDVNGYISRNKLTLYDSNIIKTPSNNMFEWTGSQWNMDLALSKQIPKDAENEDGSMTHSHIGYSGSPKDSSALINELDGNTQYIAYVTLNQLMPYEDFVKFVDKQDNLGFIWCAPRTASDTAGNIGFYYISGGSMSLSWDQKTYPYLQLLTQKESYAEKMENETYAVQHFTSMLRYLLDQKTFSKMIDEYNYSNVGSLKESAEYVEKNGLDIYGFATIADKETLQSLMKTDEVYVIATQPLR